MGLSLAWLAPCMVGDSASQKQKARAHVRCSVKIWWPPQISWRYCAIFRMANLQRLWHWLNKTPVRAAQRFVNLNVCLETDLGTFSLNYSWLDGSVYSWPWLWSEFLWTTASLSSSWPHFIISMPMFNFTAVTVQTLRRWWSSCFYLSPIILLENCLFFLTWCSCGPVSMATLRSAGTRVLIFFLTTLFGSHQSVCHQAPSLSANESSLKSLSTVLLSCCWKPWEIQLQRHAAVERSSVWLVRLPHKDESLSLKASWAQIDM